MASPSGWFDWIFNLFIASSPTPIDEERERYLRREVIERIESGAAREETDRIVKELIRKIEATDRERPRVFLTIALAKEDNI